MVRDVDPAWQHGVDVDGKKSKIKCNYCGKVITGGITRLKEHLAHKTGNVAKCTKVSPELKKEMQAFLNGGGVGTSGGDVGHQQVMYGDYYVLHPHQHLELPHEFYRQHRHQDYPQSSRSTNDSASFYEPIFVPRPHPQAQQPYGHYGSGGYVAQQFGAFYPSRNNDDDDDNDGTKQGRHSF